MRSPLVRNLIVLGLGVLFGLGLGVSGMTQPAKVLGFLDVTGAWDPSLALVMVGAVCTYFLLFRRIVRRSGPVLAPKFSVPTNRTIDRKLVAGAAIFGVGWGLAGYCPGPAITSVGSGSGAAAVLAVAMLAGMALHDWVMRERKPGESARSTTGQLGNATATAAPGHPMTK